MDINDFAAELRQLADTADQVAKRHDMVQIAGLLRDVEGQAFKIQRDQDLIDELRRHVLVMGRSLDAIGRLRRSVQTEPANAVQILADALLILAGDRCSTYTMGSCRDDHSGKTRGARSGADAWCVQCVARDALERAGALPPVGLEDKP